MLETLDYTIHIGSTPTFLYFDLYLYSAYAAHYVYITKNVDVISLPISPTHYPGIRGRVVRLSQLIKPRPNTKRLKNLKKDVL